jgi:hypothetical protein
VLGIRLAVLANALGAAVGAIYDQLVDLDYLVKRPAESPE